MKALRRKKCNHLIHQNYFRKVLGDKCVHVLKIPLCLLPKAADIFSVLDVLSVV